MNETILENKLSLFLAGLTPTSLPINADLLQRSNEQLSLLDFPTTRTEAWKYTRVGKIANTRFKQNAVEQLTAIDHLTVDENCLTFVFVNGNYSVNLSSTNLPEGITLKLLSDCSTEELNKIGSLAPINNEVFNCINTSYIDNGLYIKILDNVILEKSIQIIHILKGNEKISNLRHFIECGKFAQAHVIQSFFSESATASFTNVLTEYSVKENGFLSIDKIQNESEGNYHVATDFAQQDKSSTFTINTLTMNGTLVRNNLTINVDGENCTTNLNGAYLLKGVQHVDNHTVVDHRAPNCISNELYKGVIDDKSTAVFNGKVFVRKDSQKINAFQSNANVLLSDNSTINSKPELEIYADDVKCSHGSTTGQLDEEAVFYLRARGLSESSARNLMVSAFITDVLDKIENQQVKDFTNAIIKERFGWEV